MINRSHFDTRSRLDELLFKNVKINRIKQIFVSEKFPTNAITKFNNDIIGMINMIRVLKSLVSARMKLF